MKARYNEGMSLERIGAVLGYSPGTVRAHLLAARVVMRDSHGR
ncbi:sigma factor-like helix-turn-helix DNA-binding protein [Schaalia vaccimaxillae]|nr:sigma factor-like helix-turn-helix DNA-binding protein [Schaalia vaccimaxillae]HLS73173.1 sigma factor-like helix-turn-helix DNA-binding protein [Actinomycetaceae bacterium]